MGVFDISVDRSRLVGPDVFLKEFVQNLDIDREGTDEKIIPSNMKNLEEYNLVLKEWNKWISENTDKIIDPDQKALDTEWMYLGRRLLANSAYVIQTDKTFDTVETPHGKGISTIIGRADFKGYH